MEIWNSPDVKPDKPGEYRVALDPADASPEVRRWWSGAEWSNPYLVTFSAALKEKIRRESSSFMPFWLPV